MLEPLARDPLAVQERAVGAARVLEEEVGAVAHDARMMTRHAADDEAKIVVVGGADAQLGRNGDIASGDRSRPAEEFHLLTGIPPIPRLLARGDTCGDFPCEAVGAARAVSF